MTDAAVTRRAEFVEAIKKNDRQSVMQLLDREPSLAEVRDGELSPAMLATYHGNREIAQDLLDLGVPADIFLVTALGLNDRLASLLESDPQAVGIYSTDGWTPLHLAAHFGQVDAAVVLLDRGADLAARSQNRNGNTPLHAALAGRQTETAGVLIERGADVTAADAQGWTPLHLAAHVGNLTIVEMLLERGAEPNATNRDGRTALEIAEENGQEDVLQVLHTRASLA